MKSEVRSMFITVMFIWRKWKSKTTDTPDYPDSLAAPYSYIV